MQVNTDSISMLHKAVLETELQNLESERQSSGKRTLLYEPVKFWLEDRIAELEGEANG